MDFGGIGFNETYNTEPISKETNPDFIIIHNETENSENEET